MMIVIWRIKDDDWNVINDWYILRIMKSEMKVNGMQMSDNMLKGVYELVVIIVITCCLCIINKDSSDRIWVLVEWSYEEKWCMGWVLVIG